MPFILSLVPEASPDTADGSGRPDDGADAREAKFVSNSVKALATNREAQEAGLAEGEALLVSAVDPWLLCC